MLTQINEFGLYDNNFKVKVRNYLTPKIILNPSNLAFGKNVTSS